MSIRSRIGHHFGGAGGIARLLAIAFPMIISQASDTVMMFCDRLFLSHLGKEYISATMVGGVNCFFLMTFWFGVNGYVNALVAQHYGARQKGRCSVAVTQGVILTFIAYPIMLSCIPLIDQLFLWSNPDPQQLVLQREYFLILLFASPAVLLRIVLGSFFSGIGRTRIVMVANIIGMLANIPLTYVMVFGYFGFPELRIAGAAYGTVIGECITLIVLTLAYLQYWKSFKIWKSLHFDRDMFSKLVRYGFPTGVELFVIIAAFNISVQQFHSYSLDVAAAITITFNWDLVAFLPMLGLSVATTSLVGQNMGAGNIFEAERSLYSSIKVASVYSLTMTCFFLFATSNMVKVFIPELMVTQNLEVLTLGKAMLRLAALYLTAEALTLAITGALRGAGDTLWPMWASLIVWPLVAVMMVFLIRVIQVGPIMAWSIFILTPIILFAAMAWRYKSGKWKSIQLVTA